MSEHTNRLANATSPYLLQHAHNPVDWYPWGEEAIARARTEQKPIFLSIGYAACHWCHVMERESFESEVVAEALNRDFVAIKVDREERPDLDEIYMTATQLITQSGGWPMSVFLTPELKPFYAGTYFPPEDRYGRPGFTTLLTEIARAWRERREALEDQANRLSEAVREVTTATHGQGGINLGIIRSAVNDMARSFDRANGGFGTQPKFPPSMRLELLINRYAAEKSEALLPMLDQTLDRMARGGIYDQVGGGFHRYSVDAEWLVPHFEKMLYDNALLARVYTLAHEQTGNWYYARIAREIFDYVIREMTDPAGGFYSTTDADSEGEEGKFFVWSPDEVRAVLGEEAGERFCAIYDVTPPGNFEGHSIPNLLRRGLGDRARAADRDVAEFDAELAPLRRKLWEAREHRVHPLLDDKILSGWNGLMIRAFAEGYRVFRDDGYREAAEHAADFVLGEMTRGRRLLRSYRKGQANLNGYLEDYAYMAVALFDLHIATANPRWREEAVILTDQIEALFGDEGQPGYFFTSHDHEELITRVKNLQDNATPSGNSMAALAFIRAAKLTGDPKYRQLAAGLLSLAAPMMAELPAGVPNMLIAADEYLREWPEGIRLSGADAVDISAFLSHTSVQPGGRIWIGVRLNIGEGYHLNSHRPLQDYLIPTELLVELEEGFHLGTTSNPTGEEYRAPFQDEPLSVYSGTALLGAEVVVDEKVQPGRHGAILTLRMQACDDQQCHPPLEGRVRLDLDVTEQAGREQHPDVFQQIRAQAGAA